MQSYVRENYYATEMHDTITVKTKRHHYPLWKVSRTQENKAYLKTVISILRGNPSESYLATFFDRLEGLAFIADHILDLKTSPEPKRFKTDVKDDNGECQGWTMEVLLGLIVKLTE